MYWYARRLPSPIHTGQAMPCRLHFCNVESMWHDFLRENFWFIGTDALSREIPPFVGLFGVGGVGVPYGSLCEWVCFSVGDDLASLGVRERGQVRAYKWIKPRLSIRIFPRRPAKAGG